MVGIVIVSHCEKLAQGVVELAQMMAPDAPMAAAGGLADGGFGTSFDKIFRAIDEVYTDDGVVVLMDMGSAVMTAEMVLESMPDRKIRLVDCPVAEGAVTAAIGSATEETMEHIIEAAQFWEVYKKL